MKPNVHIGHGGGGNKDDERRRENWKYEFRLAFHGRPPRRFRDVASKAISDQEPRAPRHG
jgi:hypothetical protein